MMEPKEKIEETAGPKAEEPKKPARSYKWDGKLFLPIVFSSQYEADAVALASKCKVEWFKSAGPVIDDEYCYTFRGSTLDLSAFGNKLDAYFDSLNAEQEVMPMPEAPKQDVKATEAAVSEAKPIGEEKPAERPKQDAAKA